MKDEGNFADENQNNVQFQKRIFAWENVGFRRQFCYLAHHFFVISCVIIQLFMVLTTKIRKLTTQMARNVHNSIILMIDSNNRGLF